MICSGGEVDSIRFGTVRFPYVEAEDVRSVGRGFQTRLHVHNPMMPCCQRIGLERASGIVRSGSATKLQAKEEGRSLSDGWCEFGFEDEGWYEKHERDSKFGSPSIRHRNARGGQKSQGGSRAHSDGSKWSQIMMVCSSDAFAKHIDTTSACPARLSYPLKSLCHCPSSPCPLHPSSQALSTCRPLLLSSHPSSPWNSRPRLRSLHLPGSGSRSCY